MAKGIIWIHAHAPPRYRCTVCQKTFGARTGTPFYRRATDEAIITQVMTLVAHGSPIAAIVVAYGIQRQTVCAWLDAAGVQSEAVHWHFVCQPRDLGTVQADEIRVRQQGWVVWLALAMQVATRLWLGGVVSPRRDGALIARLCAARAACGLRGRVRGRVPSYIGDDGSRRRVRTWVPLQHRLRPRECSPSSGARQVWTVSSGDDHASRGKTPTAR